MKSTYESINTYEIPEDVVRATGQRSLELVHDNTELARLTDRMGNSALSQETLRRMDEAGVTEDPELARQKEQIELAREVSLEIGQWGAEGALRERSIERTMADLVKDRETLEGEIARIQEMPSFDDSMRGWQERRIDEISADLAVVQQKIEELERSSDQKAESEQLDEEPGQLEVDFAKSIEILQPEPSHREARRRMAEAVAEELGLEKEILTRLAAIEAEEDSTEEYFAKTMEGEQPTEEEIRRIIGEDIIEENQREIKAKSAQEKFRGREKEGRGQWLKQRALAYAATAMAI